MQITVPDSKMSIGDVRYIKFPTWFKTIQDKMFFFVGLTSQRRLVYKKTTPNIEFCF